MVGHFSSTAVRLDRIVVLSNSILSLLVKTTNLYKTEKQVLLFCEFLFGLVPQYHFFVRKGICHALLSYTITFTLKIFHRMS